MQIKKYLSFIVFIVCLILYVFFVRFINNKDMIDRDYKNEEIKVSLPEKTEYGGYIIGKYNSYLQQWDNTCAAASLRYILGMKRIYVKEKYIADKLKIQKNGASFLDIKKVADEYNLKLTGYKLDIDALGDKTGIIHLKFGHFVVLVKKTSYEDNFILFDPNYGLIFIDEKKFKKIWSGYILVIED